MVIMIILIAILYVSSFVLEAKKTEGYTRLFVFASIVTDVAAVFEGAYRCIFMNDVIDLGYQVVFKGIVLFPLVILNIIALVMYMRNKTERDFIFNGVVSGLIFLIQTVEILYLTVIPAAIFYMICFIREAKKTEEYKGLFVFASVMTDIVSVCAGALRAFILAIILGGDGFILENVIVFSCGSAVAFILAALNIAALVLYLRKKTVGRLVFNAIPSGLIFSTQIPECLFWLWFLMLL